MISDIFFYCVISNAVDDSGIINGEGFIGT